MAPRAKGEAKAVMCWRCNGTGVYAWGAVVNGKVTHQGPCFKCVGGGYYAPTVSAIRWRERNERAQRAARRAAVAAPAGRGCADCGDPREITGHMTCQYPGNGGGR